MISSSNSSFFKVAIWMVTYNHEAYIEQAIESVMMQQTEFSYKLYVGEDFSKDRTRELCIKLKKKYPDKIELILHNSNLGATANAVEVYQACFKSGAQYIAMLEGDDYWTDPLKLQKQVDFLEQHSQLNVCFTNRHVLSEGVLSFPPMPKDFVEVPFSYKELLKHHNFIVTASVVFRKPERFVFPDWFYQLPYGDMGLYKLLSTQDDFYGIADSTVVYRVHGSGIYSGVGKLTSRKLYYRFYKIIYPYLTREEQTVSRQKMKQLKKEISLLRFPKDFFLAALYRFFIR